MTPATSEDNIAIYADENGIVKRFEVQVRVWPYIRAPFIENRSLTNTCCTEVRQLPGPYRRLTLIGR
jgi:hypothetical protein